MSTEYPTSYAYDAAVAELVSTVEALWVQCDAGLISQRYVLGIQNDADRELRQWAKLYGGLKSETSEDLVEVLRELREHNARRFMEEVKDGQIPG